MNVQQRSRPSWRLIIVCDRLRSLLQNASIATALLIIAGVLAFHASVILFLGWSSPYWSPHGHLAQMILIQAGLIIFLSCSVVLLRRPWRPKLTSDISLYTLLGFYLLVCCISTSVIALDSFPTSADEYAYLFQASTLEQGRLWLQPPPLGQAFSSIYVWSIGDRWIGQYPPLWPFVLSIFDRFTPSPRLANVVVTLTIVLLVNRITADRADRRSAALVTAFVAICPFTIFNGSSLFAHSITAAIGLAAVYCERRSALRQPLTYAFAAGCLVGLLALTRLVAAPVWGLAVLAGLMMGNRRIAKCSAFAIGMIPGVALLLAYQFMVTGHALHPAYWLTGRTDDHLYFDVHSIISGLKLDGRYLLELSLWTSPLIAPIWIVSGLTILKKRAVEPIDLVFPLGLILLAFYPLNAGIRFGPRYYFDFWPASVVTIGSAVELLREEYRANFIKAILVSACYGIATWGIMLFEWHYVSIDREKVYKLAAEKQLNDAVLCMDSESGTQLPINDIDFPRNGVNDGGRVLFVRCSTLAVRAHSPLEWQRRLEPISIDRVASAYPDKAIWVFRRDASHREGHLMRIKAPSAPGSRNGN